MSTDNLYLHTFSIRGSTCAPCSPDSFTDLLHQRRRTVHCISSTCWFLESPQRIYNVFEVSVPGQFISTLFSYYLFQLHKTSHVAFTSCQNAYIMDQHDQSRCPSFLGDLLLWLTHVWTFEALDTQSQIHQITPTASQNSFKYPVSRLALSGNTSHCAFTHILLSHYETKQHP